jgi:hypothetical protein
MKTNARVRRKAMRLFRTIPFVKEYSAGIQADSLRCFLVLPVAWFVANPRRMNNPSLQVGIIHSRR